MNLNDLNPMEIWITKVGLTIYLKELFLGRMVCFYFLFCQSYHQEMVNIV